MVEPSDKKFTSDQNLYNIQARIIQEMAKTESFIVIGKCADYYKYYTGGNYWTNPVNYDLTLNSARVGREKCVEVIRDYLHIKFGI